MSKLVPKVDRPEAFAALLDLWVADGGFRPGRDSIATITWPSRDAEVVRALVERGFMPQSVFAVRLSGQSVAEQHAHTDVTVCRAIPRDADAVERLSGTGADTAPCSPLGHAGPWAETSATAR